MSQGRRYTLRLPAAGPPFQAQLGSLQAMCEKYLGRIDFRAMDLLEAHPENGWVMTMNRDQDIALQDPTSPQELTDVAESCV